MTTDFQCIAIHLYNNLNIFQQLINIDAVEHTV